MGATSRGGGGYNGGGQLGAAFGNVRSAAAGLAGATAAAAALPGAGDGFSEADPDDRAALFGPASGGGGARKGSAGAGAGAKPGPRTPSAAAEGGYGGSTAALGDRDRDHLFKKGSGKTPPVPSARKVMEDDRDALFGTKKNPPPKKTVVRSLLLVPYAFSFRLTRPLGLQ